MGLGFGALAGLAGIDFASGLIGGYVNNYYSKKAASAQNATSWEMMKYQNDWSLEQWNRENEYNAPKNIMARYQEAGLNPNLIYGNSYASPGHLESASAQPARVSPAEFKFDLTKSILSAYNIELQNELLKAQIAQTNQNTSNANVKGSIDTLKYVDELDKAQFKRTHGFDRDSTIGNIFVVGENLGNKAAASLPAVSMNERMTRQAIDLYREGKLDLFYDQDKERYYYIGSGKRHYLTVGKNIL